MSSIWLIHVKTHICGQMKTKFYIHHKKCPVREGKVFAVTLKTMTHMSTLSDRQITLNMIHIQKRLCKRNFYP